MKYLTTILLLCTIFTRAADLNAPGEKAITLGSEIQRGKDAVRNLPLAGNSYEFSTYFVELISQNKQRGKDSDGFMLGAEVEAWINNWMTMRIFSAPKTADADQLKAATEVAQDEFKRFRERQKSLGVTDDQLDSLVGLKDGVFSKCIVAWEKGAPDPTIPAPWEPPVPPDVVTASQPSEKQTEATTTSVTPALVKERPKLSVQESIKQAAETFPDLRIPNSRMNAEYIKRVKLYQQTKPEFFKDSEWPLALAKEISGFPAQ